MTTASARKKRLYAIGCCRAVWPEVTDPLCLECITIAEYFADGLCSEAVRREWAERAYLHSDSLASCGLPNGETWGQYTKIVAPSMSVNPQFYPHASRWCIARSVAYILNEDVEHSMWSSHLITFVILLRARQQYPIDYWTTKKQLLSPDIFGDNLFLPQDFKLAWRTSTAIGVAQTMYDTRDFSAMPILADALEEAGCEDAAILSHCRDPHGVHVRGCWVVDLVLGKS